MKVSDPTQVLDREQLREVTLDDEELMRTLLAALIEDTERQIPLLEVAIAATDSEQCARLAHYCKGACSNLGATSAAARLKTLEQYAKRGDMDECARQMGLLAVELDRLRAEEI